MGGWVDGWGMIKEVASGEEWVMAGTLVRSYRELDVYQAAFGRQWKFLRFLRNFQLRSGIR